MFFSQSKCFSLLLGLFFVSAIFTLYCCNEDEIPDVVDIPTTLNKDFKAPIAIAFLNANFEETLEYVPQVTVRLVDPDGMVRASGNVDFETLEIQNGVMNLGLSSGALFNSEVPYRFRIIAEAKGFTPAMQTILIDSNSARYFPIYMNKLDDPASGIIVDSTTLALEGGALLDNVTLKPKINNQNNLNITVAMQAGTQLFANNDPIIADKVEVNFSFGDPLNPTARRVFPNGFLVTDAFDKIEGQIASPSEISSFFTAGWITMEMNTSGVEVDSFDIPLTTQMDINPLQTNPDSMRPYSVGDVITVWSLDDLGNWYRENDIELREGPNGLQAIFTITHLSTWALAHRKNRFCSTNISIEIKNETGSNQLLYTELVNANSGQNFGISATLSSYAYNYRPGTQTFSYPRLPLGLELAFVLYQNTTPVNMLRVSEVFMTCNAPNPLVINNSSLTPSIKLRVTVNIDGSPKPICHNAVWYKTCTQNCINSACISAPYLYAGHLTSDNIDAGIVDAPIPINNQNQDCCMRIWYSGNTSLGAIKQQDIDFDINFEAATNSANTNYSSLTNSAVDYQFDKNVNPNIYRIFIDPSSGLTEVESCP